MSIESWKKEFYPIPAEDAAYQGTRAAIEHSLRKWQGMREENAARHGLTVHTNRLRDQDGSGETMSDENCALCWIYNNNEGPRGEDLFCVGCPLAGVDKITGDKLTCCSAGQGYNQVLQGEGPEVLIAALQKALED